MFGFIILFLILLTTYIYGTNTFDYWKRRGIKHDRPLPLFGTNLKCFFQKASLAMRAAEVYRKYPEEKVVGFYLGRCPTLIVRDSEIIKRILVTDFQHFQSRGVSNHSGKTDEIMTKSLLYVDGDFWRTLRHIFNPGFSAATIRSVFPLITKIAKKLQLEAEEVSRLEAYDMQELMTRYTRRVIVAYLFGKDMECLRDEQSQFRKLGEEINQVTLRKIFVFFLKTVFPQLFQNVSFFDVKIIDIIKVLVNNVIKERNGTPVNQTDFLNVFLKFKENSTNTSQKNNHNELPVTSKIVNDSSILVAQVYTLIAAGLDTTLKASSYTLHELAFHPKYQENVQKEIDNVLAKHNNEITYDAVNEMKYLQMAFSESVRIHPPAGMTGRMCTSNEYVIPEINLRINKGVKIIIPIHALHNDAQYFEEPEKFKPERFDKFKNEIPNYVYMPFGAGPRVCIGAKLGQLQSLAGLAAILHKFTVEPASCTVRKPSLDPKSYFVEPFIGGLPLKLRKRKC